MSFPISSEFPLYNLKFVNFEPNIHFVNYQTFLTAWIMQLKYSNCVSRYIDKDSIVVRPSINIHHSRPSGILEQSTAQILIVLTTCLT